VVSAENHLRSIVALGRQDTEIEGLSFPEGTDFLGATSDHMVIRNRTAPMPVGSELRLGMNYNALMRIMAAPDTAMEYIGTSSGSVSLQTKRSEPFLHLV
jgi:predicted amino acid racemase